MKHGFPSVLSSAFEQICLINKISDCQNWDHGLVYAYGLFWFLMRVVLRDEQP